MNYYNEINTAAADWLESLVKRQLIPKGVVDRRSIEDVLPDELSKYTQCHFFAGIGGWSRALELAGFPSDRQVWTGSCPCQPFSSAGKGAGTTDERNLWPALHWLIKQCRPELVFGEQVAGKAGESWFDIVQHDLAAEGYTSGMSVLAACSVGAPHIRKRLYWVGHASSKTSGRHTGGIHSKEGKSDRSGGEDGCSADGSGVAGNTSELANTNGKGPQGRGERGHSADEFDTWGGSLVYCRDGKARPFKPGILPLSNGLPGRMELIKGYGNAIVPQCGAAFIEACA